MKTTSGIVVAILSLLTISAPLSAQQSTFAKVFYDNSGSAQAYSIIKSFDNNYMIVGEKDYGALLLKMDPTGTILWNKKFGSTGSDRFNVIIETNDSCFVMAGYHLNMVTNIQYVLCVKVNSQGDTLWSKIIDNGFYGTALSIRQTIDNGYILAGYTFQTSGPSTVIIVDKLDPDGNLSWSRILECGTHHNYAYSVKQTPDSGYIVTGSFDSYEPPESPALLIKLTQAGTISWAFKYTGYSVNYSCVNDVVLTSDGLLFSISTNHGIVLMKTDFSGNVLWSKNGPFGGQYGGESPMPKLCKTNDNGYAFINTAGLLLKIDSVGNFLWSHNVFMYPSDVVETDDGGFIVLGNGPVWGVEMTETLNPQIGIIKTDSLGNSSACVFPNYAYTDTITSILIPVSVTTTTSGTQTALPLLVSSAGLSADSGCVAYSGSVKEINRERNSILIYPNPSNGLIQLKTDQTNDHDLKYIKIYNGTGECIHQSFDPLILQSPVDITTAPDGIYYIQVVFGDKVCTQKFTITH